MTQRTVSLSSSPTSFESVQKFLSDNGDPSGLIEIQDSYPIHIYFRNRKADVTFVSFAAALGVKRVRSLPFFGGMATSAHLKSNTILISDPSLILDHKLGLAWYAGNSEQVNLQRDLTAIIKKLARDSRLVFFGASGGGFASLEQSLHFENSTALVSNPQIDIRKSPSFPNYANIAWGGMDGVTKNPPIAFEVLEAYSKPTSACVVYLQNQGDSIHMEKHWKPFFEALHSSNRALSLTPHIGDGHISPDKETFKQLFSTVTSIENWDDLCFALEGIKITRN